VCFTDALCGLILQNITESIIYDIVSQATYL